MVDPGIGRLLIASLHQGVADISPTRLPFYEDWLSPTGLREGRMGLAPLGAVLSFVHRESPPDNQRIPDRAGWCAADWTCDAREGFGMRLRRRMALKSRTRSALKLGKALVVETIGGSRVSTTLSGSTATVEVRSPLFDYLREPAAAPMRRYYAAAFAELLGRFDVDATVEADESGTGCRLIVTIAGEKVSSQAIFDVT